MKILVDRLPKTKDECLFCIHASGGFHRCLFNIESYDFHGLTTTFHDCALTNNEECPFLEVKNETLDR